MNYKTLKTSHRLLQTTTPIFCRPRRINTITGGPSRRREYGEGIPEVRAGCVLRRNSFGDCNIAYDSTGRHLLAGALETLNVWHVRQGICTRALSPSPSSSSRAGSIAVSSIASSSSSLISCGYSDGSIRIWDCEKGTCETTLNGHRGAVTILRYNKLGSLLASGSKDCDVILWDTIAEAGIFRLQGHRDQVTDLVFLDSSKKLVSSSKDKFLRVWDLDTQHCIQIVGGHHSEIWSIDLDPTERYLVSGSADPELRFYSVVSEIADQKSEVVKDDSVKLDASALMGKKWIVLKHFGDVQRQSKDRVSTLRFCKTGNLLACQVAGTVVELFRVLDDSESKQKAKRRILRKEKKAQRAKDEASECQISQAVLEGGRDFSIIVADVFRALQTIRVKRKICSISFCPISQKGSLATLALSLNNNLLEVYTVESASATKTVSIELQGHRSYLRSLTLSSDNSLLMSTSHGSTKIWNPSSGVCLRTIDSGSGWCGIFVPGNKYAIIGTKDGTLEIIDVRSGTCVEAVKAHGSAVRSIVATSDGFITGSSDQVVKLWEYQIVQGKDKGNRHPTVCPVRKMEMTNDVDVIAVSPDEKHIAVALIDFTVKVFFLDSLKFYLSLYGHKLNLLCMDISSDCDLIITGSADKNVKIWGLDFGDCHKSLFAHADSVTGVKFVKNTHYFFTVGKDRMVKYWDADKFELLLTLEGHHSEIWGLAVSSRGDFLVTGSYDRSIRRWDRTEEPFFIEEEKEKRLEEMFEADIDNAFESNNSRKEELPEEGVVALAGKKTVETITAADSIMEALDTAVEYEEEQSKGNVVNSRLQILMLGLSPSDYVLRAVSNVHTNELEQALLALPFSDSLRLLPYLKDWIIFPDKVELVSRLATVLSQIHHNQLTSTPSARPILSLIKDILHARVKECKDTLGYNLAAMSHIKQLMATKSDAPFRDVKAKLLEIRSQYAATGEASKREEQKRGKKKRKKLDDGHVWS